MWEKRRITWRLPSNRHIQGVHLAEECRACHFTSHLPGCACGALLQIRRWIGDSKRYNILQIMQYNNSKYILIMLICMNNTYHNWVGHWVWTRLSKLLRRTRDRLNCKRPGQNKRIAIAQTQLGWTQILVGVIVLYSQPGSAGAPVPQKRQQFCEIMTQMGET